MEMEVAGLTGAALGERSPDPLVQRNGYRDRDRETHAGTGRVAHPEAAARAATSRAISSHSRLTWLFDTRRLPMIWPMVARFGRQCVQRSRAAGLSWRLSCV